MSTKETLRNRISSLLEAEHSDEYARGITDALAIIDAALEQEAKARQNPQDAPADQEFALDLSDTAVFALATEKGFKVYGKKIVVADDGSSGNGTKTVGNLLREFIFAEYAACVLLDALSCYADPSFYHACRFLMDPPTGGFDKDFDENHGDPFYERDMPGKLGRETLAFLRSISTQHFPAKQ